MGSELNGFEAPFPTSGLPKPNYRHLAFLAVAEEDSLIFLRVLPELKKYPRYWHSVEVYLESRADSG